MARSEICELCGSSEDIKVLEVAQGDGSEEASIFACSNCRSQIESGELDETHFKSIFRFYLSDCLLSL